jgi:hypothetical protein
MVHCGTDGNIAVHVDQEDTHLVAALCELEVRHTLYACTP